MNLQMDISVADKYKSSSQIIRRVTENWMAKNMFCPRCGNYSIEEFENNRPVADFFCSNCQNQYELKSSKGKLSKKIEDGAYATMISRITSDINPDFFFLSYDINSYMVNSLIVVPKHFFTPDIIEARPPLSSTARRAGWIGCKILLNEIPLQGRISIIDNSVLREKNQVVGDLNKSYSLVTSNLETRGWLMDILKCINLLPNEYFSIDQMYLFEEVLANKHPNNNNVQAKIRQQLQLLRDKGYVKFLGNGKYQKLL